MQGSISAAQRVPADVVGEAQRFLDRLFHQLSALAGREREMRGPVEVGIGERDRRKARRETRRGRMHGTVDDFRERRGRVRIGQE